MKRRNRKNANWYRYGLILTAMLSVLLLVAGCNTGGGGGGGGGDDDKLPLVTTRDDKGVWFISGDPDESLFNVFEAEGYAVATDRL